MNYIALQAMALSSFSALGYVHGHDAWPVEHNAAAAGDHALAWLTGFRILFERRIFHFLHHLEPARSLALIFWNGLIDVCRHNK